jgi:hypothetical protein
MMEEAAGLPSPTHAPPTKPRALNYRVAADIMMTMVRGHRCLSAHVTSTQHVEQFPLLREHDPEGFGDLCWTLGDSKGSPLAVLHIRGYVFTSAEMFHLPTV